MHRRVGILTFHQADNYGAVLQAYGLARTVQELGHAVEIIDYRPAAARKRYRRLRLRSGAFFAALARRWKFREFRKRFLPLSRRTYLAPEDLVKDPPQVDCIVCGSDQVWNVDSYRGFDPPFFLSFARGPDTRRTSYAATFGSTRTIAANRERISDLLCAFDFISVRDADSQNTIHELIGRFPPRVLDPSFLTDFGEITAPKTRSSPYIVAFSMECTPLFQRVVATLSQRMGLPVVSLATPIEGAQMIGAPSPQEWLSLMRHARLVVTNSFHGLCFAIINRRDFYMVPRTRDQNRLDDLLTWFELNDRVVTDENFDELIGDHDYGVDYSKVEQHIDRAIDESRRSLCEAIHG